MREINGGATGHTLSERKVQASYADGVLTLLMPKKAAPATRKIAIQ